MLLVSKLAVGVAESDPSLNLGYEFEEQDLNNADFGIQGFAYKKVNSAVAVKQGSPVGDLGVSGGNNVTAAQATSGAKGICQGAGGISTIAVGAGVVKYGFVQIEGVNRYAAQCTGAVAAGVHVEWSGNDTIIALATAGNEFGHTSIVAAAGLIPAGGLRIFGA